MSAHAQAIANLTLSDALQKVQRQELSREEIYEAFDHESKLADEKYKIFLSKNPDALSQAKQRQDLPLAGLPIAIKDNFATKGIRTTASSTVLDEFVPQYSATVIKKLEAAGGVVSAKTNMDAWAHGSSTETSQYFTTLNPRNPDYSPGGSSGGSAAAVTANACLAALGTETAGSIRLPASVCGVVGFKPTYGRISRQGIVAMASSTDSPGPITKTVKDAALLYQHIAGHDPLDGTTANQPVHDLSLALNKGVKGLKIGLIYSDYQELSHLKKYYEDVLRVFEEAGAQIEATNALDPSYAIGVYTVVQRAEVSSNLARFDDVRYQKGRDFFGDEAKRRIMLGTFTLSKGYADQYYNLAQKVRTLFLSDFKQLFSRYDLLISPTTPGYATRVGSSKESALFGELADVLLEPSSVAGLPAISLPCHVDPKTNLFLGLNIMAPAWKENLVFQAAALYEAATNWNTWLKQSS